MYCFLRRLRLFWVLFGSHGGGCRIATGSPGFASSAAGMGSEALSDPVEVTVSLRRHPASFPKRRHPGARFSSIEPLRRLVLGPTYRTDRGRRVGSVIGGVGAGRQTKPYTGIRAGPGTSTPC
ncbi:hypothetical protein LZ31DRAFT_44374 [Colletotrichum somersetense]|nr:hypothetical protein LZ31DRAFT_44374 [Colletotrichum somersetense]